VSEEWIFVSAGEVSGDLRCAELLAELRRLEPGLRWFGLGGDRMSAAGVELLFHVRQLAFLGFLEIIRHLPFLYRVTDMIMQEVKRRNVRLAILVDYPGYHLFLARKLKAAGCKVIYYIGPQIWAWAPGRINKVRERVDYMLVIFPFEERIYSRAGVPVTYVGHPLVDHVDYSALKQRPAVDRCREDDLVVGLLPGSRAHEVRKILPDMLRSVALLKKRIPGITVLVSKAPTIPSSSIDAMIPEEQRNWIKVEEEGNRRVLSLASVALVASGTSTLEAACYLIPAVIMYRVSPLTYLLGRLLIRIPRIGLVNIVAGYDLVPEFIQNDINPAKIASLLERLLQPGPERREMVDGLHRVREKLGPPGAARRAARKVIEFMSKSTVQDKT